MDADSEPFSSQGCDLFGQCQDWDRPKGLQLLERMILPNLRAATDFVVDGVYNSMTE